MGALARGEGERRRHPPRPEEREEPRGCGALPPCGGDRRRKDGGPRKEAEREIREVIEDGPHVPLVRVTHEASEMVGDDEERHRLCTNLSRDRQDPHGHEAGHHRDRQYELACAQTPPSGAHHEGEHRENRERDRKEALAPERHAHRPDGRGE